ncbi:MAG: DNA repair ATPase [Planctomycetales bacterium]|nr:DNA repair ATPase [Planctomycetales bacterium]
MTESLASGTYEVLRNRLTEAANTLRERFQQLNAARSAVFGNIETRLLTTAHVATDNNCVPRDLLAIGNRVLLGYNVQFGLKSDISTRDVFSLYRLEGEVAHMLDIQQVFDDRFQRDFAELYRYYKNTTFQRFFTSGPLAYFVFQVGKTTQDVKAFKWAIEEDSIRYIDNRSDQEVRFPEQHAFRWLRANRDMHRTGKHPHISIQDIVFVECVGGDLTIKIEDNTEDGSGIYAEPVEHVDQTLDDAEVYYCVLGNIVLLKMRPYQEREFRYLVFSTKRQQVTRLDALAHSCQLLPDDHGLIFADGFFLQTGDFKLFDHGMNNLLFERMIAAPNGEDYLYIFTDLESGTYLHLRYNLIRQEVDTPLVCHGQALFEDGQMVTFRSQENAQKHHALQVWQTPMVGADYKLHVETDSLLYKIGNRELVRGMAECQELLLLLDRDDSYADLYLDVVKRATDLLDNYFWIDREETQRLAEPLRSIRDAAAAAVEEFDKVVRVRRETEAALNNTTKATEELLKEIQRSQFTSVIDFVQKLSAVRTQRGHVIGLRERRYIDLEAVEKIEQSLIETAERVGHRCVQFLLDDKSLVPYHDRISKTQNAIDQVNSANDGRKLSEQCDQIGDDLELLIATVSQLKIEDLTQRTAIVDRTGDLLAELNRVRSTLKAKVRELLSGEMEADFASQTKLIDQAVAGALETADTPEKVDDALTRLMLQLEELEGRFAEFDELLIRLTEKRETLYEAFEARRQQLTEARSRRADGLGNAADRILQGIASRSQRIDDADQLRSYFASDPMVDKVRQIADQLKELGDSVRMEDVLTRLKTLNDDAIRQLRDRKDLYTAGEGLIQLGRHAFSVNRQPIELTTVTRGDTCQLHLTGTQFYQPLHDPALDEAQDLWNQHLPSESTAVYRAEFLAHHLLQTWTENEKQDFLKRELQSQTDHIRALMQPRHDEGYSRGVHDRDTAAILGAVLDIESKLHLLRFSPAIRSRALYVWLLLVPVKTREKLGLWMEQLRTLISCAPETQPGTAYKATLQKVLSRYGRRFLQTSQLSHAADYLFRQLLQAPTQFIGSQRSAKVVEELLDHLPVENRQKLLASISVSTLGPLRAWALATDVVDSFVTRRASGEQENLDSLTDYLDECALRLVLQDVELENISQVTPARKVSGLVGDHTRISHGEIAINYHEFQSRLGQFRSDNLPRFQRLRETKHRLLQQAEKRLRIEDFKPKVLTSFVRNRLIDEVYLPLVGDNLAKQIGASGEGKRTDRMGLLLLISPPGYGKTTLMEYIASRLGLVFVKINGPALGHQITSLDPAEATNAAAREEVQRINMALEMSDNVMLYLDDIQHCNPELLQKFIPLCDATRRIEGVWEGQPKSYDLRGKRIAVVMAGNPYTESGERFQIPDMLSNRADIYNLGEIIGESREAFELSYIENCLTSNPVLQPLARCSSHDQRAVIRAAERGSAAGIELESTLSPDQVSDCISVLQKLLTVRDVVLRVNRAYIRSAAQADAYRTEPPFKLQGSYRNMNRIAERVVPVMNSNELLGLVIANYEQDAQTLTRDGESNLLKFKELIDRLTKEETERWEQIKFAYVESVRLQGISGEDSTAQVLRTMAGLRDGLESIRRTLAQAIARTDNDSQLTVMQEGLAHLNANLTNLGQQVAESISNSAQRVEKANQQLPEQKVLVQHSVPRVMTDLIKTQFQLLYDGLRPVLEASALSSNQLEGLKRSVDTCLEQYRAVQAEINRAGTEE